MNSIKKITENLKSNNSFLLTTHVNADGDGIGSILGLGESLELLGKKVFYFVPEPVPLHFSFLSNFEKINKDIKDLKEVDLIVVLDAPNIERIEGFNINAIKHKLVMRIDHHKDKSDNSEFNYVKIDYPSTTCIVWKILKYGKLPINKEISDSLYTGLLTDTGSFRFNNTNKVAFSTAKELVENGANPYNIARMVYEMETLTHLKLLGLSLMRMEIIEKLGFSYITQEDMKNLGASDEDIEGIVDYIRKAKDCEAVLFLKELKEGGWKGSLRSKNHVDVRTIAEKFGGGGHKEAAGFKTSLSKEEILKIVLEGLKWTLRSYF